MAKCHIMNVGGPKSVWISAKCPKTDERRRICGEVVKSCKNCPIDSDMATDHTRGMKRTTIWLSSQQVKELSKLSKKTGIKQAELIRRFVDVGIAKLAAFK